MFCRCCSNAIEPERQEVLPDTVFCSRCAISQDVVKRKKGILVFEHKTGGYLQTMSAADYDHNKRYFVPIGARSVVKNFSKHHSGSC